MASSPLGLLWTNKNGIRRASLEGVGRVKVSGYRASSAQMTSITGDIIANYNTGLCKFLCGISLRYFYQIPAPALHGVPQRAFWLRARAFRVIFNASPIRRSSSNTSTGFCAFWTGNSLNVSVDTRGILRAMLAHSPESEYA